MYKYRMCNREIDESVFSTRGSVFRFLDTGCVVMLVVRCLCFSYVRFRSTSIYLYHYFSLMNWKVSIHNILLICFIEGVDLRSATVYWELLHPIQSMLRNDGLICGNSLFRRGGIFEIGVSSANVTCLIGYGSCCRIVFCSSFWNHILQIDFVSENNHVHTTLKSI